jgi:hypothetical protein
MQRTGPGLKEFLQRAKVLHTYRDFIRLANQLPSDSRPEVMEQIQREFRLNAIAVDNYSQRGAMAEASRQRKILASYVATATTRELKTAVPPAAASAVPTSSPEARTSQSSVANVIVSHSSTTSTPKSASGGAEEYEGRLVGQGWPWARPVDPSPETVPVELAAAEPAKVGTGTDRHFRQLYTHRLPHL